MLFRSAIVKKMIEEHFGQIKIENNLTGGACITIALPIENAILKPPEALVNSKKNVKKQNSNSKNKQKLVKKV